MSLLLKLFCSVYGFIQDVKNLLWFSAFLFGLQTMSGFKPDSINMVFRSYDLCRIIRHSKRINDSSAD